MMRLRFSTMCVLWIAAAAATQAPPASTSTSDTAVEGEPLSFRVKLLAIDTNEGCDVGDVNQDGVMDIVAGRFWFAGT